MRSCFRNHQLHDTSYEQKGLIFNKQSLKPIMKCIVFHYLCTLNFVSNACCREHRKKQAAIIISDRCGPETTENVPFRIKQNEQPTGN